MMIEALCECLDTLSQTPCGEWDLGQLCEILLADMCVQTECSQGRLFFQLSPDGPLQCRTKIHDSSCKCMLDGEYKTLVDTTLEMGEPGTVYNSNNGCARTFPLRGAFEQPCVLLLIKCNGGITAEVDDSRFITVLNGMKNLLIALQRQRTMFTEHKKLIENAHSVSMAKDAFLANMSHEIRTPLNGIIGMTRLLMESQMTAEHREFLTVVHECGFQLLDIINDILDYSKMACGRVRLNPVCFDLRECIETSYDVISLKAREKDLDVSYWIDPSVPMLLTGDMKRLRQVIVNLLSNAVKFTSQGTIKTTVRIGDVGDYASGEEEQEKEASFNSSTTSSPDVLKSRSQSMIFDSGRLCQSRITPGFQEGDGCTTPLLYSLSSLEESNGGNTDTTTEDICVLRFEVEDSGIGIPEDKWLEVFDPFSQVDSSLTRGHEGTGLGLPICKQLTSLMHGKLWVERSSPETGTTIIFTVALKQRNQKAGELPDRYIHMLHDKQVLVVDDNATNRMLLCNSLLVWGMKPFVCSSAEEAMLYLRSGGTFHMAFIDVRMPRISGVQLAEAIRKISNIPMVALSSIGDAFDDPCRCFIQTLVKPVKASMLFNVCVTVLQPERKQKKTDIVMTSHRDTLQILVVDDFLHNQTVALKLLQRLGHQNVDVANNGEEAVRMVQATRYDAVLMDLKMPVCDGVEATRRIMEMAPDASNRPYIIAMTAMVMERDRERCLEAGMDAYLSKPLSLDELETMFEVIHSRKIRK